MEKPEEALEKVDSTDSDLPYIEIEMDKINDQVPMEKSEEPLEKVDSTDSNLPYIEIEMDKINDQVPMEKSEDHLEKANNNQLDNHVNILKLLSTPTFMNIISELPTKEAMAIFVNILRTASSDDIAEFFGVDVDKAREASKRVLIEYKTRMNSILDETIENIDHETKKKM